MSIASSIAGLAQMLHLGFERLPTAERPAALRDIGRLASWREAGLEPPRARTDLTAPLVASRLWLNTDCTVEVARVLGVDLARLREIFGREVRADHLLAEASAFPYELTLIMTDMMHTPQAGYLAELLQTNPAVKLSFFKEGNPTECWVLPSIMQILTLAETTNVKVLQGDRVRFVARGKGADVVLARIRLLNESQWKLERVGERRVLVGRLAKPRTCDEIARKVHETMRALSLKELSGLYDTGRKTLVFGETKWGHATIARASHFSKAFEAGRMVRVNFYYDDGVMMAYHPYYDPFVDRSGKFAQFRRDFAALFQGMPFSPSS